MTFDVEEHAGASLRYHRDGSDVTVTYERAACTHGGERSTVELEGSAGAARCEWVIGYEGPIGVQSYGVGGDPYANLERSYEAYRSLWRRLAAHPEWAAIEESG